MSKEESLQQRIEELETKVAFQEETIEQLHTELFEQQKSVLTLQTQMNVVINKMKSMQPSNMASESDETPPPHY